MEKYASFQMVKLRSMIANADASGDSTSGDDARITPVGHFIDDISWTR